MKDFYFQLDESVSCYMFSVKKSGLTLLSYYLALRGESTVIIIQFYLFYSISAYFYLLLLFKTVFLYCSEFPFLTPLMTHVNHFELPC